jgi:hypothetical protein
MHVEAESVSTGRTEVGAGCDIASTDAWVGKATVTSAVAETDVLCVSQAEKMEMNIAIAIRL